MMRKLAGMEIPRIGLGCMGMSEFYGKINDEASLNVLAKALEMGYRHFDTANMYGFGHNETLLGKFLKNIGNERDNIVVATKVGIEREKENPYKLMIKGSKSYIKKSCDESLKRLQTDYIDLYYLHRIDPTVPLEESIEALKELKAEGKIKSVGLCEVSPDTLKEFNKLMPVEAVQSEYSLWTRDIENTILPVCEQMDISIVAFSPMGRGFLTGKIGREFMDKVDAMDFRARLPRFNDENIDKNLELVKKLDEISEELGVATSQLALSWVLHKSKNTFVIPGTKQEKYLEPNFTAKNIDLNPAVVSELDSIFSNESVYGSRYPADILAHSNA